MIDTDKMRMAFAATPLCQNTWAFKADEQSPTMLCAVSALVSFAGVQPELIAKMVRYSDAVHAWFTNFAAPVLKAEYGIPLTVAAEIPRLFDKEQNEWRGVTAVLDHCEAHNMAVMAVRYAEAIVEDAVRFPQHTCAAPKRSLIDEVYAKMVGDLGLMKQSFADVECESGGVATAIATGSLKLKYVEPPTSFAIDWGNIAHDTPILNPKNGWLMKSLLGVSP